ncbi:Protein of uncharacterised function (DUF1557) [Moraxella caviae]|nr:Protein of uncharacterised function (DUF1557) [Moraxella caviae]
MGKVGIEGNAYVPLSAMQGKSRSEVKRLYDSNISYFNANCIQTSANCNSIVDNMIKFADSGYVALNYPDLRDRTIILLRDNPAVLERYFNNKVAQFNAKDRSILNMYLLPALEVAGGVAGAGGSIAGTTYACAQTAGFGCYAAAVAGSAGFTSSVDHIVTGSGNIGRPLSQQDPTAFVKFLKSQGLSEATATNLQLAIDVFGTGGIGVSVGSSTKGVGTSAQAVKQAKSQVTATPKATQTKATCSNGTVCFTAGTLIETSEGLKAVETFTGGELIWSRNDITLEYGYHPVIATKATPDQPIFQVTVKNNQGDIETLETTAEHPFWIKETGWLKASLLEQGMILLDRNNQEVEVLSQYLIPNHTDTVYNIEVDNFHTYHVGRLGVWVHNAQCCDLNVGIWGKGSYNDSMASLQAHFNKHGAEVGAETIEQYLRKAEAFKQNLRGATKSPVAGETNGVIRYKKNGKYIDIAPDGSIISFGKQ